MVNWSLSTILEPQITAESNEFFSGESPTKPYQQLPNLPNRSSSPPIGPVRVADLLLLQQRGNKRY